MHLSVLGSYKAYNITCTLNYTGRQVAIPLQAVTDVVRMESKKYVSWANEYS